MKKKNHIKMRFSTLLLCCLAIVLCAAPALQADMTIPAGATEDIDYGVKGILWVKGTANLLPGASAQFIYVQDWGTLNMYSGTIDIGGLIYVGLNAVGVTVYGTDFAVSNGMIQPDGNWTPDLRGTLTGYYDYYGVTSPIKLVIASDTPIHLKAPDDELEIDIDIKPGSELNKINLKSKGVIPVAVITTVDFNAGDVDPATVVLAGASHVRWTMEDVDNDGDKDMLFHFKTQELKLDESITEAAEATKATETTLTLTGNKKTDLKVIQGTDKVCIVSGKK